MKGNEEAPVPSEAMGTPSEQEKITSDQKMCAVGATIVKEEGGAPSEAMGTLSEQENVASDQSCVEGQAKAEEEGGEERLSSDSPAGVYVAVEKCHGPKKRPMPIRQKAAPPKKAAPSKKPLAASQEAAPAEALIPAPPPPPQPSPPQPPPIPPPPPPPPCGGPCGGFCQQTPCKFWAYGRCRKGENCPFWHEEGKQGSNSAEHHSNLPCKFHFSRKGCCGYMPNGDLGSTFLGIIRVTKSQIQFHTSP